VTVAIVSNDSLVCFENKLNKIISKRFRTSFERFGICINIKIQNLADLNVKAWFITVMQSSIVFMLQNQKQVYHTLTDITVHLQ